MVKIEYVEYDASHPGDFEFDIPEGHDRWLLVLTQTPAKFFVSNDYIEYPPNYVVLYKPGQKIYYRACTDRFSNDWIRFETDEACVTALSSAYGIPFPVKEASYCHKLFQLLVAEHILNNSFKEVSIENLIRLLFNKLLESYGCRQESHLGKKLNDLRMNIYLNPDRNWNVTQMAREMNISVGYLENIYKKTFGISCMGDVIKSRIDKAKKYLLYEKYTIVEIAFLCGYCNVEHFYRQFKKLTGITPNCYRSISKDETRLDT